MHVIHNVLNVVFYDVPVGARTLTISGEMGIGKSRLLTQAIQDARARNFRVLEMYAYEGSDAYPYFPFVEALRPILRTATNDQLRFYVGVSEIAPTSQQEYSSTENISLLGFPLVTSLARLFPELLTRLHVQPLREQLSPEQEKFRLFDSIATLLERLALERPLFLSIDNLQWVDAVSLELILYLTIRLRTSRVALIGATRPIQNSREQSDGEAAKTVTRVLTELMQQGMWFPLPLGPLDAETIMEHIHALLPGVLAENIVHRLLTCCEGNPFFLEELVRTLTLSKQLLLHNGVWSMKQGASITLPESIRDAVRQRLHGLSAPCFDLLCIASLFGRRFPADALIQVVEQEHPEHREKSIHALLDEAIHASLIANDMEKQDEETFDFPARMFSITRSQFIFCQGIVQEMLHDELPTYRVRALHYAIGQALEHSYMHNASKHAAELAAHYIASSDSGAALRWSVLAGEAAIQQQDHRKAISHFRLVLQLMEAGETPPTDDLSLPVPAQLYLTIGELWFKVGEFEPAIRAFQSALERQDTLSPLLRARTNRSLADVYRMQAKYAQALSHLQAASTAFEQQGSVTHVREQEQNLPWFFKRSTPSIAPMTLERVHSAEYVLFLQAQATLDILLNHPKEAEKALWQSHQLAITLGDCGSQAFSLHLIGWLYGWGEHIHDAIRLQKEAHALYVSIGDPFRAAMGEQGLGIIYQALGETETAHVHTQRGFKLAQQYGVSRVIGWLHWNQGVIALHQGDWSRSDAHLQQALQEAQKEENARLMPVVLQAQAVLLFRRGLWREAERLFLDAIQAATHTDWFVSSIALYGHFLAVTGRRTDARIQLDRASTLPEPPGFSGTFYIPFLAEGYLHLNTLELATPFFERITKLRGFLYYGLSVDRVLGELATLTGDWATAERAFEDGLHLCRRANNQPEEAQLLYEQARMGVMRGADSQHLRPLCEQARKLFLEYDMKRAAALVDTLLEGVLALETVQERPEQQSISKQVEVRTSQYVIHLKLTTREREVLQLVAEGHTDREVADTLVLSPRTVNRHLSNILVKLNVSGRAAAVAYAIRQGLV
ncbi:MAG: hypothetical protein PVS3B3_19430 [Ktedonobacteraceae bacterium]